MLIRKLSIQGFRSFKKKQVFNFPGKPCGFFLLSGRNKLHPSLGANAAGKSTIWDALAWVLFGKTARGLRGSHVANWERTDLTSIRLSFELDGDPYKLSRAWDPTALMLEKYGVAKSITQEELEAKLGINYAGFMNTVLMGQFNQFFFDLTPTDKLSIFSDSLDLGVWLDASDRAREKASDLEAQIQSSAIILAEVRGHVAARRATWKELREKQNSGQEDYHTNLEEARKETRDAKVELHRRRKQLAVAEEESKDKASSIGDLETHLRLTKEKQAAVDKDRAAQQERYSIASRQLWDANKNYDAVCKLEGNCPTCGQEVTTKTKAKTEESLAASLKKIREGFFVIEHKLQAANVASEEYRTAVEKIEGRIRTARREQEGLACGVREATTALGRAREWLLRSRNALAQLREAQEAAVDRVRDALRSLRKEKARAASLEDSLKLLRQKRDDTRFWVKGFKDVRLWIVEQALTELEILVNSALADLGLKRWKVLFDVERENASGGISKGFSVFVHPPGRKNPVPWEAYSGGETQRLRIAGAIGLAKLIRARRTFDCNLEVWDEPTAHLSPEGIEDLLAYFSERARSDNKQIWLVDHRSLDSGGFDDHFHVVKDIQGSHIVSWRRKYDRKRAS